MDWGTLLTAVAAVITAVGGAEVIKRRQARKERLEEDNSKRVVGVAVVEAEASGKVLNTLLEQMNRRIESYEQRIREMQQEYALGIAEVKAENRDLERQVSDLRRTLQDYQLGQRVPQGYVLVPIREIQKMREQYPGALDRRTYPGEDFTENGDTTSITARITPLNQPHRERQDPD